MIRPLDWAGAMRRALLMVFFVVVLGVLVSILVLVGQKDRAVKDAFLLAQHAASPTMVGAIEQTRLCTEHGLETPSKFRGDFGPNVWTPCYQQGETVLRDADQDAQLPEFRRRVEPVYAMLATRY